MEKSLYHRLGEEKGIAKLVEDVLQLHIKNPIAGNRFFKIQEDKEHYKVIKNHAVNFFCMGSGGPQKYEGAGMTGAHRGMNISEEEYIAIMDDVLQGMEMNNYGDSEKKDVLAILYSLKGEIIRV